MSQEPEARSAARRKWAKRLLIPLAAVSTFFALEGGLRLYLWLRTGNPNVAMNWKISYEPYLIHASNDRLHKAWPPKGDKYRILVLGGSTAERVPDEAVIRAFGKSGRAIDVVNLGNGGFILNQETVMLALYGVGLEPDLILSLDGANDVIQIHQTDRAGVPYTNKYVSFAVDHPVLNVFFGVFRGSQLVNMAFKLKERTEGQAVVADVRRQEETLAAVVRGRETIALIAAGLKVPYIAVLQPYLFLCKDYAPPVPGKEEDFLQNFKVDLYRRLAARLRGTAWPWPVYPVDGTLAFGDSGRELFVDGVHLSPEGSRRLMDYVYAQAVAGGWTPAAR